MLFVKIFAFVKCNLLVKIFIPSSFQSVNDFHHITDETLEALSDFFDGIADTYKLPKPDDYDVNFGVC